MSLTFDEKGLALTETIESVTMPVDCSFEKVNDWIHGIDVQYEELEALCLGMATENDKLRKALELAKEMFICNDMALPHTFEVIDDALKT